MQAFSLFDEIARLVLATASRASRLRLRADTYESILDPEPLPRGAVSSSVLRVCWVWVQVRVSARVGVGEEMRVGAWLRTGSRSREFASLHEKLLCCNITSLSAVEAADMPWRRSLSVPSAHGHVNVQVDCCRCQHLQSPGDPGHHAVKPPTHLVDIVMLFFHGNG